MSTNDSRYIVSVSLAAKLGSIIVHVEELLGPGGGQYDVAALRGLLEDKEVKKFLKSLGPLVPVKR